MKKHIEDTLAKEFKINGHELQLSLQLYFDRFVLGTANSEIEGLFNDIQQLAGAISNPNLSIIPLFSIKQLQLASPKIFHDLSSENSKLLIVSLKKDHEEKNLNELPKLFQVLKLEEFSRNHPEILIIVGYPEFIYHLPIRDIAIYHYENTEIRLINVNKGKASNSIFLDDGMQLNDLLDENKTHLETSPPSTIQNAEILNPDEIYNNVLKHTNRCFFVMNCSKTCPACSYQDTFFQEAAANSKACKFVKYYVSNQCPHYKGPNSTPRYYLYLPGITKPVEYEPKLHGLKPENFLHFIDTHLANLSSS